MKPCPIGESGACCRICSMGPCRLVGKDAEEKTGICGADMATIASRHFARQVAGGVAAHSDHGRDMAMTLRAVAKGEAAGYKIKDEQKLMAVAGYMGIATAGREVNEIALDVADKALEQFGQPHGEIIYTRRATPKRQELWRELGLTPRAIDREVTEVMHRTHEGVDLDAENILKSALRCSLADGWGGAMLSTDISDILFGTPSPLSSEVNLGVLKDDQVNVIVHGHEPTLSAMLVEASRDPELIAEAKAAGAKGINLAGICCTSNEILMRYGIPAAGNFLHQELAVLTGAVEAMVVDVQCIMQALGPLAQRFHTQLITTSPKAKIPGAVHVEFDEHRAPQTAAEIVRMAIANYPNRGPIHIPDYHEPLVAGFSHEYLNYMQGGFHRGSFRPLNDAIIAGRVRGLAGVVGCNNVRVTQDEGIVEMIKRFIAAGRHGGGHRLRRHGRRQGRVPEPGDPRRRRPRPARGHGGHRHPAGAASRLVRRQLAHPHRAHAGRHRGRPRRGHRRPARRGPLPRVDVREGDRHRHLLRRLRRPRDLRREQPGEGLHRGHPPHDHGLGRAGRRRPRVHPRLGRDVRALARAHRRQARGAQAPALRPVAVRRQRRQPFFAAIREYLAAHDEVETVGSPVYPLAEGHSHDHGHGHTHDEGDA